MATYTYKVTQIPATNQWGIVRAEGGGKESLQPEVYETEAEAEAAVQELVNINKDAE